MQINKKYLIVILIFIILVIASFVFIFSLRVKNSKAPVENNIVPTVVPLESFTITATDPKNDSVNIYPGEIKVSFTTSQELQSEKDFSIVFFPALEYAPQLTSNFPTQQITYQILGGLRKSTLYTVTVKNRQNIAVGTWFFTTSDAQPQSSSGLVRKEQDDINQKYYPLFDLVPYNNSDFSIDYTGRLALIVKIRKNNVDAIRSEVLEWIKKQGVDPSTHTIVYQNDF